MITDAACQPVDPIRISLLSYLHGFSPHIHSFSKNVTSLPMKISNKFNRPTLILQQISKDMLMDEM